MLKSNNILKIGLMTSGRGEGSFNLIKSINEATSRIPVKIEFIFCNREKGEHPGSDLLFEEITNYDAPIITISSRKYEETYEDKVLNQLSKYNFDLLFLVGYMLITNKIHKEHATYNLHPALPNGPKGKWDQVINELIDNKCNESGLMIHKVIDEVDSGECLSFCSFNIDYSSPNREKQFLNIRQQIIELESKFICKTLEMISFEEIKLNSEKAVDLTKYLI
tara:strand:- start:13711 stop:14376 length:666 start_codon:yes stop_codon:yes gene_type:complete